MSAYNILFYLVVLALFIYFFIRIIKILSCLNTLLWASTMSSVKYSLGCFKMRTLFRFLFRVNWVTFVLLKPLKERCCFIWVCLVDCFLMFSCISVSNSDSVKMFLTLKPLRRWRVRRWGCKNGHKSVSSLKSVIWCSEPCCYETRAALWLICLLLFPNC